MATYINYGEGEDDATVQGAEWLKNIILLSQGDEAQKAFVEKFQKLHENHDTNRLYDHGPVFDLFVDYSADVFASIPELRGDDKVKEVESFFALVLSMLLLLEDEKHLDQATTRLCEVFTTSTEVVPDLRLRLLMMLYNTFNNPTFPFRYRVFKYVLDYAAKAGLFDQCMPYLEYLDAWMVDWDLPIEEKRVLFRDIAKYTRALNKRVDAFQYLKRFHLLYEGCNAEELKGVNDATVELITDAVQIPSVIQFDDLVKFDSVKALEKGTSKELVALCRVFLNGSVQDLRDFEGKNKKLFEQHDLSLPDAMSKIRLLTLATLAHGKSEISLSEVAKALDEKLENVEPWVVRAISEGFIDGRIDQLNCKVLVKSSFQRKFETDEWQFLDTKLTSWIDNLEDVIKFIGEQKQQAQAAPAGA